MSIESIKTTQNINTLPALKRQEVSQQETFEPLPQNGQQDLGPRGINAQTQTFAPINRYDNNYQDLFNKYNPLVLKGKSSSVSKAINEFKSTKEEVLNVKNQLIEELKKYSPEQIESQFGEDGRLTIKTPDGTQKNIKFEDNNPKMQIIGFKISNETTGQNYAYDKHRDGASYFTNKKLPDGTNKIVSFNENLKSNNSGHISFINEKENKDKSLWFNFDASNQIEDLSAETSLGQETTKRHNYSFKDGKYKYEKITSQETLNTPPPPIKPEISYGQDAAP